MNPKGAAMADAPTDSQDPLDLHNRAVAVLGMLIERLRGLSEKIRPVSLEASQELAEISRDLEVLGPEFTKSFTGIAWNQARKGMDLVAEQYRHMVGHLLDDDPPAAAPKAPPS